MLKKIIAKEYYAIFEYTSEAVEVEFPDIPECVTFGSDMEEAYEMAVDVLAGWLEHAEAEHIPKKRLTFKDIKKRYSDKEIMLIPVDKSIMKKYEDKQRFNASFPKSILEMVDNYAMKKGWNRSQFLVNASKKYINDH